MSTRLLLAAALSLFAAACQTIPILGIDQANKPNCPANNGVYFYRDYNVGVCMPLDVMSYVFCVKEISGGDIKSTYKSVNTAEVASIVEKVKGIKLSSDDVREIDSKLNSSPEVQRALSVAIETCKSFKPR